MGTMGRVLGAAVVALGASGCSMTLPVRGHVGDAGETFAGSATGYADGGGNLAVTSSRGAKCGGGFVYVTRREGEGTFTCDDGRSGPFTFVSTGTRGTGKGSLSGQPFTFTFGKM